MLAGAIKGEIRSLGENVCEMLFKLAVEIGMSNSIVGLFSPTDDKINLDSVAEEVGNHKGIIWTHVISLRREDAERLGYNRASAWRDLVRRNVTELAEAQKIDVGNLWWYGAFHNTTHHPHMHLLVYSKDAKQGWLTNKGIESLRSALGNDIFRNEQYKLFTMETGLRDRLKKKSRPEMGELLTKIRESYTPSSEVESLFLRLVSQLKTHKGRKQYGYLPRNMKETVNKMVAEIAKDGTLRSYILSGIASIGKNYHFITIRKNQIFRWKITRSFVVSRT